MSHVWPGRGGGEGRLWISLCSIQGGRLQGGGEVLRRFSTLTTSLVGKEGRSVSHFGRAGLWSPERKSDSLKVTRRTELS